MLLKRVPDYHYVVFFFSLVSVSMQQSRKLVVFMLNSVTQDYVSVSL